MEHRWGARIRADLAVRLLVKPAGIGSGRILDLSLTGAFVQTELSLPALSTVYLEPVGLERGARRSQRIAACVIRCGPIGFGLEWCDSDPHAADSLLAAVRAASEADRTRSCVADGAPEMMRRR